MKITILCVFVTLSTISLAQNSKLFGKFVISSMAKYEDGIKTIDIDVANSGDCPYYYTFFESAKFILTDYDDDDCNDEIRSDGSYTIYNNVLTISLGSEIESYQIDSITNTSLTLSYTEEESRGFGGYATIKYQYIYKRVTNK